jgi:hypothetical protein
MGIECHSASTVYLFSCERTVVPGGAFPPSLGPLQFGGLFYRQARPKLQVQA